MKNVILVAFVGLVVLLCAGCNSLATATTTSVQDRVSITKEQLLDKIKGGWAAKTIGCTYGGPVEFQYNGTMIQDYTPIKWSKDRVKYYFDTFPGLYDDLYVDIVFVNVFERLGLEAPADSFAIAFANGGFPLWHANQVARYNVRQGIMPPMSGHWLNNPHADDIDYQIEADFAGLMSPGMPNTASSISDKVGHIFTYGDGWYGGVYVGALYSMAFVSDNMECVVREALKTIPVESNFYRCVKEVIELYKKYPNDWKRTWFECQKKWTSEVGCPDGVFMPFDIDAKINSAYVTIGLLYGKKDFYTTVDIAARCGQDSDCNAATAAGILGTMIGYSNIPEIWRESLYAIENIPFAYTNVSLNKLYELSLNHALQVIEKEGGKVDNGQITIKTQKPIAVKYEQSFVGHLPVVKIPVNIYLRDKADFIFEGIGFVQRGYVKCVDKNYVAKVEMYIDGALVETANLPVAEVSSIDNRRVDLFHRYQLPLGKHKVSYKWLNPCQDAEVSLGEAVIYSNQKN
nr:ADP-ribosylglycohydrolase family protein [uncultured Bacteroides sp.]